MITFTVSIIILVAGYFLYGKFAASYFGADSTRITPAVAVNDGVDYTPMPLWKIFIIQFLNIAGLGPIFGAILGAAYGPMAYIWIVLGCIFMGAGHDYFSGMLSIRNNGASLPELVGKYLGNGTRNFLRFFTLILLIFVGVAFVSGPAKLLSVLTGGGLQIWLYIIFGYYFIATLFPINKIIGKVYPFFGAVLLLMAIMVAIVMIFKYSNGSINIHELNIHDFKNFHRNPQSNLLYPMMFIVISCGAISGFHATQSPLMARCLKNEKHARPAFYGAMVAEGIVTIIWATAAMNYFGDVHGLNYTLNTPTQDPAWIVNEICNSWLGKVGAAIAIIGVVVCPVTTGDTAFRSARLTIADSIKYNQKSIKSRLIIAVPIFIVGFLLTFLLNEQFGTVWKFVGISNQILAAITLWTIAMYFALNKKNHLIMSIPAFILTVICFTYLIIAPVKTGGLGISGNIAYWLGIILAVVIAVVWYLYYRKNRNSNI
ncbi:MAG TPA: carbon starvation CstA family protein [Bacteroidales bacterium]|nr:carbon starvation CstA family protein [Bacteroidales bacterium]